MTSDSSSLPVEILDLILLIILPGSPGLVGLLWSVLPLLWSLLWLLDVVVVPVLDYLAAPALVEAPVFGYLRNHLVEILLALRPGRPGLLASGIDV